MLKPENVTDFLTFLAFPRAGLFQMPALVLPPVCAFQVKTAVLFLTIWYATSVKTRTATIIHGPVISQNMPANSQNTGIGALLPLFSKSRKNMALQQILPTFAPSSQARSCVPIMKWWLSSKVTLAAR